MIIERLLEKRASKALGVLKKIAKQVEVDLGEGTFLTYDSKDPHGKEDAETLKKLREPVGVGGALVSGILPALLSGALSAGGTYALNAGHSDALKYALMAGGVGATGGGLIGALSSYGTRLPMQDALSALNELNRMREAKKEKAFKALRKAYGLS